MITLWFQSIALFFTAVLSIQICLAEEMVDRPKQTVLLSFDNCQENQTWKMISEVLLDLNNAGSSQNPVHFTFYLSAVDFLTDFHKQSYENPSVVLNEDSKTSKTAKSKYKERARRLAKGKNFQSTGESNIDFGGTDFDLKQRIQFVNQLYHNGNEFSSHAVGHFDGGSWTEQMWRHEFQQYETILRHIPELNGVSAKDAKEYSLDFSPDQIRGFRAPYLSPSAGLYPVLKEFHYEYDSSSGDLNFDQPSWPTKIDVNGTRSNIWNAGLGMVNLLKRNPAGKPKGSKRVTAMDYNFCFEQSNGCEDVNDVKNASRDAEDMLNAYFEYFLSAYNGNRAPVNIGHHFFPYRGGVYNQALLKFAKVVCSMPEVQCTTFSEMISKMNVLTPKTLDLLQKGQFPKASNQPNLNNLWKAARLLDQPPIKDHGK